MKRTKQREFEVEKISYFCSGRTVLTAFSTTNRILYKEVCKFRTIVSKWKSSQYSSVNI